MLDHFCIKLSDVQYRHLLAKLSVKEEESKVDWKQFLHVFNLHNQEVRNIERCNCTLAFDRLIDMVVQSVTCSILSLGYSYISYSCSPHLYGFPLGSPEDKTINVKDPPLHLDELIYLVTDI